MRILKLALSVLSAAVVLTSCAQNIENENALENGTSVLTVVTSAEPETQLMALILSKAAADQGTPVRILLCDKGGDLALKTPPNISLQPLAPKNMSPAGLLTKLVGSGVKVDVCAIYLPNREFGVDDLIDGVGVATPSDMAANFTQNGAKVLSF